MHYEWEWPGGGSDLGVFRRVRRRVKHHWRDDDEVRAFTLWHVESTVYKSWRQCDLASWEPLVAFMHQKKWKSSDTSQIRLDLVAETTRTCIYNIFSTGCRSSWRSPPLVKIQDTTLTKKKISNRDGESHSLSRWCSVLLSAWGAKLLLWERCFFSPPQIVPCKAVA